MSHPYPKANPAEVLTLDLAPTSSHLQLGVRTGSGGRVAIGAVGRDVNRRLIYLLLVPSSSKAYEQEDSQRNEHNSTSNPAYNRCYGYGLCFRIFMWSDGRRMGGGWV
jgi:hypothetical protein